MAENPNDKAEEMNNSLKNMSELTGVLEEGFRELTSRLSDVVDEIREGTSSAKSFDLTYKDINRSVKSLSKITEDLVKNQVKINNNSITSKDIQSQINKKIAEQQVLTTRIGSIQKQLNEDITISENERIEKEKLIIQLQKNFNELAYESIEPLKQQKSTLESIENSIKGADKELGVFSGILKGMGKIPIIGDLIDTEKALKSAREETIKTQSGIQGLRAGVKNLGIQFKDGILNPSNMMLFLVTSIVRGFNSLNKAQTDFTRETGRSISHIDTLNTSLITSSDYIKQATAMTKELGLAADLIFTPETLQEATELVELMGLSANEAGRLSMFSKINGKELKSIDKTIINQVSNFNKANKTAISQKQILKDITNISNAIAITFGGNPEKLAAAATEARKLGLTLEQIDKTAESLLNFESSINSEISAELMTGQQLNLEKARLLALNNDLAGLTKEIGNNEAVISGFSKGNRIQQQAIADAIGLSKDELSKMIFTQQLQNGLTEEAAAAASGVALEDMKRLSVQDSINKSIEKMGEALAGPLELVASLLSHTTSIKILFTAIAGIAGGKLARSLALNITSMGLFGKKAREAAIAQIAGASAAAGQSAAAVPVVGWITALGAIASVGAAAYSMFKGDDVISPGYGDRTLLTPKGSIALNNEDTVIAGTNLGGGKKSSPNQQPQQDLSPLLNELKALRQEQVKSNSKPTVVENSMNGTKFGTSVAMNTYKTQ